MLCDFEKKSPKCLLGLNPERKGERVRSTFANTPNKENINGKQTCFYIIECRTRKKFEQFDKE